jgi:hypothetical protein
VINMELVGLGFGADFIRNSLGEMLAKTEAAADLASPNGFISPAHDRRVADDARAGRLSFHFARQMAERGLKNLDEGNLHKAAVCWRESEVHYVTALELTVARSRAGPKRRTARSTMGVSSKPRGRPQGSTTERDQRLFVAVGPVYTAAAARSAVATDPFLKKSFGGMTTRNLSNAYNRGKKNSET